jgi:hypothetical protein
VRPGEHACCRFAHADAEDRLVTSFMCDGLGPGHKVLCFSAAPAIEVETARLARMNAEIGAALGDGRLDVLAAHDVYLPDGCFEADRMVAFVGDAHGHALRDGFAGLSVNGDMRWALSGGPAVIGCPSTSSA